MTQHLLNRLPPSAALPPDDAPSPGSPLWKIESLFTQFAVENAGEAIFWIARDGQILYVNTLACKRLDFRREQLLGMKVFDIDPLISKKKWTTSLQLLKRQKTATFESLHRRRDGKLFPVELNVNYVVFAGEEYIYTFSRDITARRQIERALLEREKQINSFFLASPAGMAILDRNGCYIRINQQLAQINGIAVADHLGRRVRDIVPSVALLIEGWVGQVFKTGKPLRNIELQGETYREPGVKAHWIVSFFPIHDLIGNVSTVGIVLVEVTDQKRAENKLRECDLHFRSTLNSVGDIIFTLNRDGRIMELYGRGLEELAFSKSHYLGKTAAELYGVRAAQVHQQAQRRALKGQTVIYEWQLPDPPQQFFQISLSPLKSASGDIQGIVGVAHDIGELKRLESDILEIRDRERQRIGHDLHDGLGQHLAGMSFLVKALQKRLAERSIPEAKDAGELVELTNAAIRQTRALSRGLAPAALQVGLITSLGDLAGNVKEIFGIRVTFTHPRDIRFPNMAAETHLYRIAQEAVHNALAHGKPRQIDIRISQKGGSIELRVRNDGHRFKPSKRHKGLGLQIIQHRARMIGGSCKIRPQSKGGTILTCRLPIKKKTQ